MARLRSAKAEPAPTRKPLARLTERHERFVEELLIDDNATRAYKAAGFGSSGNAAEASAARLRAEPIIAGRLAEARAARAVRAQIDADWVLEMLMENVSRAMQREPVLDNTGKQTGEWRYDGSVANGALNLIGKHLGMFVDRVAGANGKEPIQHAVSVTVTRRIVAPGASE